MWLGRIPLPQEGICLLSCNDSLQKAPSSKIIIQIALLYSNLLQTFKGSNMKLHSINKYQTVFLSLGHFNVNLNMLNHLFR